MAKTAVAKVAAAAIMENCILKVGGLVLGKCVGIELLKAELTIVISLKEWTTGVKIYQDDSED